VSRQGAARRTRRHRSRPRCETCGKAVFTTKRSALAFLRSLAPDRVLATGGERIPWRAYEDHGAWHVTSQPKRDQAPREGGAP
jgi:hypothetical protein